MSWKVVLLPGTGSQKRNQILIAKVFFSFITTMWKSKSSEKYQAADHLRDLRIFSLSQFDSLKPFRRTSFYPKLLFCHFYIFSNLCHFLTAELFLTFQSVLLISSSSPIPIGLRLQRAVVPATQSQLQSWAILRGHHEITAV